MGSGPPGFAACGVTSVQPTFITASLDRLGRAGGLCAAAERGRPPDAARVLGAHVEGPFINPAQKGAHHPGWMLEPTDEHLDALLEGEPPRTVTLAPELPGALAAIARLTSEGVVVSLGAYGRDRRPSRPRRRCGSHHGHAPVQRPAPYASSRTRSRGRTLVDSRLTLGLIVDGHHVHPDICRLAFAAAPNRLAAVTDSILNAGLPPHTSLPFGGLSVGGDATGAGRRPDGTLAGSGIVLDEGLRRMITAGVDSAAMLSAWTATPARALGRGDLGQLRAEALADLVWWDGGLRPRRVWIDGREIAGTARRADAS